MDTNESLKALVREKYGEIAGQSAEQNASSCCGSGPGCGCGCGTSDVTVMTDSYEGIEGYVPEADLALGCGIPTDGAGINEGDTVLDLGSGAGNDVFVARRLVGESGRVIGVDMTEPMHRKANENLRNLGYTNVEFRLGDIENLPVTSASINVALSNCVMNLVPDKQKAFSEVFRVLKPGGHFSISDIVLTGNLPASIRSAATMYAGCVSGALQKAEYLDVIRGAGFRDIEVRKEKPIVLPNDILKEYLTDAEVKDFRASGAGIWSITVVGRKR